MDRLSEVIEGDELFEGFDNKERSLLYILYFFAELAYISTRISIVKTQLAVPTSGCFLISLRSAFRP